jgi:hypothetical protein
MCLQLVTPSQFVDEMLEMRRRPCRFRTKHLLEAFADSVADRPGGSVIEWCNVII